MPIHTSVYEAKTRHRIWRQFILSKVPMHGHLSGLVLRAAEIFCEFTARYRSPSRHAASIARVLALIIVSLAATPARAEWPERTITLIIPFAAGGPGDVVGRLLASELSKRLGQNVIVENRVGAVGDIGLDAAARARPDGYTLVATSNVILINPSVSHVAYDPIKSFEPIAYLGASPNAIITRPGSGIASIAELIAKARANPDKLTYATTGVGSVSHLAVRTVGGSCEHKHDPCSLLRRGACPPSRGFRNHRHRFGEHRWRHR